MNIETLRTKCISKPGVTEGFPFDNSALVFKVMGKMFLICNVDKYTGFSAKCAPDRAVELREAYPHSVLPGYHLSKTHWNSIVIPGDVPDALLTELIDHSYTLVVSGLTSKLKKELNDLE